MNDRDLITNFCQTIEKKEYVIGIVSNIEHPTLFLDIYLNGEPIFFHLSNGTLHYSCLGETTFIEFRYHNLHSFSKEYIKETNSYLVLERLKEGIIQYDKTQKLTYYQKLLTSSFSNPLLKLYQKEKSHRNF